MIDHLWTIKKENKVLNICTCSLDMSPEGKYTSFLFLSSEYEFQFILFTVSLYNIVVIIETLLLGESSFIITFRFATE